MPIYNYPMGIWMTVQITVPRYMYRGWPRELAWGRCHIIFWTPRYFGPGFKISLRNIDPPYHILNPGFIILWLRYNEPGFKILWLRNIQLPTSYIYKGGDLEYYGCETMTHVWFSLLGGGGPKYYGCEISKPTHPHPPPFPSPIHHKGGDSEYCDCEILTSLWFP
jgi:hypothetical protein